jgi:[ribosomal protein S18]-alanine N-acetyltransferase
MIEAVGADAADVLAALHARAFDKPWNAGEFAALLENPLAFARLARGLGLVLGWTAADEAEILTLAVTPEARRQGTGAALVSAAAAAAQAAGARALRLEVAEANHAARGLYAKLGFAAAGRRPGYYSGGGDALILRLELSA